MNDWLKTTSIADTIREQPTSFEGPQHPLKEKTPFSKFQKKEFKKQVGEKKEAKTEDKDQKKKKAVEWPAFMTNPFSEKTCKVEISEQVHKVSLVEAKQAVDQISVLIQKMIEELKVGKIDGHDIVSVDLKKTYDVPTFFQGATLTVVQVEQGKISIDFTNLTQENMQKAISVMELRKSDLEQLVQNLNKKNISIASLRIGDFTVILPSVENNPYVSSLEKVTLEGDQGDAHEERKEHDGE